MFRTRATALLTLAVLTAVGACDDDSSVLIVNSAAANSSRSGLVEMRVGGMLFTDDVFRQADAISDVTVDVPNSGNLDVRFEIAGPEGQASSAVVTWELRANYEWQLNYVVSETNPWAGPGACPNECTIERFALPWSDAESLWVVWSGVPLGSGVIR